MGHRTCFNNARIYTPYKVIGQGSLTVDDGKIVGIVEGAATDVEGDEIIDVQGQYLLPGFVDVHVHGGGGFSATDAGIDPTAIENMSRFHASKGTTTLLPTTVTADQASIAGAVRGIVQAMEAGTSGANIAGIHLEGPFFNPKRCGAQDPQFIRPGTVEELRAYVELGRGAIRLLSIAPETPGADEVIAYARSVGITVSLGHSDANLADVKKAIQLGATHVTHLFNGMSPLHHREPGLAGSALALDELAVEVICDGIHVQRDVVSLVYKAKPQDKVVLITDAISACGCPDGEYMLGNMQVILKDGQARLKDSGTLSGSCLTLDQALRNAIQFTGRDLFNILPSLTLNPARQAGLDDRIGSIKLGKDADVIILNGDLQVASTYVKGRKVF